MQVHTVRLFILDFNSMKQKKLLNKISIYFLPVLFSMFLFSHLINHTFKLYTFERKDENRRFNDTISLNINHLDNFPKEYSNYLSDNFTFRTPLLNFYHHLKFNIFKISPHPEKTIIGKSGWYFLSEKELKIIEGKLNFNQTELIQFENEWQRRKKFLDSLDIKYHWVIAPMKHNVYNEYLPFNVHQSKNRRIETLVHHLSNKKFPDLIIDPVPEMKQQKDSIKLFYHLDNHWNYRSGYLITKLLLSTIQKDFPNANIPDITEHYWEYDTVRKGIHYDVLGIKNLWEIEQKPIFPYHSSKKVENYGFPPVQGFAYPWDYEWRFVNDSLQNGLRILIIRDSFGFQVSPFIRDSFKESLFIFDAWQYKLNEDIILKYQPDVVIFLGLETHIDSFIKTYN